MDEKKKTPLSSVWNQQLDKPKRELPKPSDSIQRKLIGFSRYKEFSVNRDVTEQSSDKFSGTSSQKFLTGAHSSNPVSKESSKSTYSRRDHTKNSDNFHPERTKFNSSDDISRETSKTTYSRTSCSQSRSDLRKFTNTGFRNPVSQKSHSYNRSSRHTKKGNLQNESMQNKDEAWDDRNKSCMKEVSKSNQNFRNHPKGPLSFTHLKELVTKEPNEILLTISRKDCGYMILIAQEDIRIDVMALVLILLGKACSADSKQILSSFLNAVVSNQKFLLISIQKFLVSLRKNYAKDFHLESLSFLASFLQNFQHILPSSSTDSISMLLPLLSSTCKNVLNDHSLYSDVMSKLKDIEEQNEYFLNHHTPSEIKKATNREKQQLVEPPENFRSLPVLPNADDIYTSAFLRPNLVEGKYSNTEHYLDVQYRLLREDYVKPLRDGIAEYLRLKESGKSIKNCKDVRVYENVHIVKQDYVNGGIVHIAELSDINFSKIKWEYSKRFLSGSLLCLSSDNFKTMLFASVARRLPDQLKKGLLLIRFEEISNEVLNISPFTSFVIVETSAYFEAYRHNLKALHELTEDKLPLKKYIVDVETTVDYPKYLQPSTRYDMRPLLIPMDNTNIKPTATLFEDFSFQYEFPASVSNAYKSIPVLDDSCWPSACALNLDDSQYIALKAAVTKEFSIIQGPPGTGKTYIGLRIVQLLLHNIDKWLTKGTNSLPILVVCFTNHALDQFLEGMMHFTNKIVRIGGRGTNEAVSKFQLHNLKKSAVNSREIPRYIASGMWHKNQELRGLKIEIETLNRYARNSLKVVFGEKELKKFIPYFQYISLKSVVNQSDFIEFRLLDDDLIIHDWLGVRSRIGFNDSEISEVKEVRVEKKNNDSVFEQVNEDVDVDSIGEADVEFIEAQRDIDCEDFADVSFDIETPEKEDISVADDSGWQIQGGRKQKLKYIKNSLFNNAALEESEAMKIKHVWDLSLPRRWQLYRYWLQSMITEKEEEIRILQAKLKRGFEELHEMQIEGDIFVLQNAHVVGMTTTGAAKYRSIVQRLNPQILIVEEAAEILESHIVTSLATDTQHVILIGDHQQLRPSPTVHMLAVNYDLNISLFERMIKNQMDYFRLSIQHRMRPDITDLIVPHIYKDLKNHDVVTKYENIKGVSKNVFFITHNYTELQEHDSKSKVNEHEAKFLVKLCNYFVLQGYDPSQITVLTTYTGQLFVMKKLVKATKSIQNVRFTVVDNYQGEENDIILISFVRSNEEGEIGFLKIANRVCVALSRAKKGLYCIGNFELLAEKSGVWKNVTDTLQKKQAIGPSLQLLCQNHPGVCSVVADAKDFESVPEGGCTKVCEYRLSCGHVCSLMCHPYDRMHEFVRCHKKCNKTCEEGHECPKKCFEVCGPCLHLVEKTVHSCGHTIKVHCHMQDKEIECYDECKMILPCGHKCPNKCGAVCPEVCRKRVKILSPICNHEVTVECCYKNSPEELIKHCRSKCKVVLDCGHMCKGNCNSCHQGRLHVACNQPCKRILVCGHECKSPCAKSCPPCKFPCENRCIHSKCPKECGDPCDVCTESCEWKCTHKKCSRICGDSCNRVPCNEPCLKLLPCKHPCIGFCGEPCPEECRECNSETVKEIFFGTEDDDDSRFVKLEDCKHILEISGLNEWIKVDNKNNHQIKMKECPKCKTVIRTNLRFGNTVKDCLRKIENVKRITFGNVDSNMNKQKKLLEYLKKNDSALLYLNDGSILLYDSWEKILLSKKCRNIQEITNMENIIDIALQLAEMQYNSPSYVVQHSLVKEGLSVFTHFRKTTERWLKEFMHDEFLTASEQQLKQLSWEIHRLKLGSKLFDLAKEHAIKVPNTDFEKCVSIITNYSAFGKKDSEVFSTSFKALVKSCGSAVINVSDIEKQSILKAMNLAVGHWYQCPNGHVYCITECGGAMEESKCNECSAKIGGTSHQLLSSNRVAREMDGARHSAWSDAVNLENYILED